MTDDKRIMTTQIVFEGEVWFDEMNSLVHLKRGSLDVGKMT